MSLKRSHVETEELLHIKLADAAASPLAADRAILYSFSSCVRGLPSASTEWDLSQLVIEGQAVERQTVVAWLNAVGNNLADDEVFEQQNENPARKVAGLVQLIAFADAVGSSKRLMREVLSGAGLWSSVTCSWVRSSSHSTCWRAGIAGMECLHPCCASATPS